MYEECYASINCLHVLKFPMLYGFDNNMNKHMVVYRFLKQLSTLLKLMYFCMGWLFSYIFRFLSMMDLQIIALNHEAITRLFRLSLDEYCEALTNTSPVISFKSPSVIKIQSNSVSPEEWVDFRWAWLPWGLLGNLASGKEMMKYRSGFDHSSRSFVDRNKEGNSLKYRPHQVTLS